MASEQTEAFSAYGLPLCFASPSETLLIMRRHNVVVRFSYQPSNPDELELRVGDVVWPTADQSGLDVGWLRCEDARTERIGVFPANYVAAAAREPRRFGRGWRNALGPESTTGNRRSWTPDTTTSMDNSSLSSEPQRSESLRSIGSALTPPRVLSKPLLLPTRLAPIESVFRVGGAFRGVREQVRRRFDSDQAPHSKSSPPCRKTPRQPPDSHKAAGPEQP